MTGAYGEAVAGVWERWGGVIIVSAAAVPVVVLLIGWRARTLPWRPAAAEIGAIAGTLPWLWMILTPLPQPGELHPMPFQEVPGYLAAPPGELIVQLGGNLAVFAAFGALAPLRWRLGPLAVTGLAAVGSITVETLQYALSLGRVASVDDVLLNASGALLASLLTRTWWRIRLGDNPKSDATLCR